MIFVDYVSMHQYYGNRQDDSMDYLAQSDDMEQFIRTVTAVCDYKGQKRGRKNINISFDEWNVWFHSKAQEKDTVQNHPWQSRHLICWRISIIWKMHWMVGLMPITLLKHADRVKIACMAQLINVIAPVMAEENGTA